MFVIGIFQWTVHVFSYGYSYEEYMFLSIGIFLWKVHALHRAVPMKSTRFFIGIFLWSVHVVFIGILLWKVNVFHMNIPMKSTCSCCDLRVKLLSTIHASSVLVKLNVWALCQFSGSGPIVSILKSCETTQAQLLSSVMHRSFWTIPHLTFYVCCTVSCVLAKR